MASKTKKSLKKKPEAENSYFEVTGSDIHGWGAFAKKKIAKGKRIVEYLGEKIDKKESARRCEDLNYYIFEINDEWDIDGDVEWNPARFLNHSCEPNCEAVNEGDQIWIDVIKDVKKGDELTFNYGYDIEDYRDHPCRCGAGNCLGYIVAAEFFDDVRRKEKNRKK